MAKKNKKSFVSRKQEDSSKKHGEGAKVGGVIFHPLQDRVLIKEDTSSAERTTAAGIIIPVTAHEDKGSKQGVVVAVGPGRKEDGKLIPVSVAIGSRVLFQWGDKVKVGDEEYYLVRESEILAVIS